MAENNSNLTKDLNLEIPEAKQISKKINQGKLHQDMSKNCQHRILYTVEVFIRNKGGFSRCSQIKENKENLSPTDLPPKNKKF